MHLIFTQPGKDTTAPRFHPELQHEHFWTMCQSKIERMCKTLNPEAWAARKEFKRTIYYSDEKDDQIEKNSGIYHFGWMHHVRDARTRVSYQTVHYSKDKFTWDEKLDCAVPIDGSKFIMTIWGWDWKEMPHFREDWLRYCAGPPPLPAYVRKRLESKPAKRVRAGDCKTPEMSDSEASIEGQDADEAPIEKQDAIEASIEEHDD